MTTLELIQMLAEGKLSEGERYISECNERIVFRVGYRGESLTESWLDAEGDIIRNNWTIHKDDVKYVVCKKHSNC